MKRGRERKQPVDTSNLPLCRNCGKQKRARGYSYCSYCLEYLKPKVRIWARQTNPIPGVDIPEC